MIKTFLIDFPDLALFGAVFALLEKGRKEWFFKESGFKWGLFFSTVFIISVIISYIVAPDWMWMYFPEKSKINLLDFIYILIFMYYMPYIAGYAIAKYLKDVDFKLAIASAVFYLLWAIYIVARLFDRYYHVGTREEYLNGTAPILPSSTVGTYFNFVFLPLLVVAFAISLYFIRFRKREV